MKTKRKRSYALSMILVVLSLNAPMFARATGDFVTISLPKGVSIELPRDWVVLSNKQRVTLDTFVESGLDLSGIDQPDSDLSFAANYYDEGGDIIGKVNVRYYPQIKLSQADAIGMTNQDLQELDAAIKQGMIGGMKALGMPVTSWRGTSKRELNGITAFITDYHRESARDSSDFRVRLARVFAEDKSFTLTASYSESAARILGPITDRIIDSLNLASFPVYKKPASKGSIPDKADSFSVMSYLYGDQWNRVLLFSFLITWGVGLLPPFLIRFVLMRRPISRGWAVGVVALFWVFNVILSIALESQSKTHTAFALVAFASYLILRKGAKKYVDT
jgi:hypothetical protein